MYITPRNHITLCLHRVLPDNIASSGDMFTVSESNFKLLLYHLRSYYKYVSIYDFSKISNPQLRTLAFTFDDIYRDFYLYAYPALRDSGIPAHLFITLDPILKATPLWHDNYALHPELSQLNFKSILRQHLAGRLSPRQINSILSKNIDFDLPESYRPLTFDQLDVLSSDKSITFGFHGYSHFSFRYIPIEDLYSFIIDAYSSMISLKLIDSNAPFSIAYPYGSKSSYPQVLLNSINLPIQILEYSTLPVSCYPYPRTMVTNSDTALSLIIRNHLLIPLLRRQSPFLSWLP